MFSRLQLSVFFFYVFAQCLQDKADNNKIGHNKTFVTLSIKRLEL